MSMLTDKNGNLIVSEMITSKGFVIGLIVKDLLIFFCNIRNTTEFETYPYFCS